MVRPAFFLRIILFCSIGANLFAQAEGNNPIKSVRFQFQPVIGGVNTVTLAGTFNDWNDSKNPMQDLDGDGVWETTLLLTPDRYLYKFVVDGSWLTDPNVKETEPDGQGGLNGILNVSENAPDVQFARGDSQIHIQTIPVTLDYSMVNPLEKEWVEFKMRTQRGDVESVNLLVIGEIDEPDAYPLTLMGSDPLTDYYQTRIKVKAEEANLWFAYEIVDGEKVIFVCPSGIVETMPDLDDMFYWSMDILPPFPTPSWAKDGVFYQIFPERFRNGDKSNDPDFSEPYYQGLAILPESGKTNDEYFHLVEDWNDISGLTHSPFRTDGKPDYYSFYGGDIAGIFHKLRYLKELGVTIIYFNPLNAGQSNHKYDPIDYLQIDPHFADESTFKQFVKTAHDAGIRIIVDMAFNHTGDRHFAFVDTKENGPESEYWDWFEWREWPLPQEGCPTPCDYYDCWWGFPLHPNLNFDLSRVNDQENDLRNIREARPNMKVVDHVLDVARYWIGDLDIDGFRLDVANEVPFWFWEEFRTVVDSLKPDALLIGEIWGNAMPWLGPDCFHTTMNYKYFREPVLKFFGRGEEDANWFDQTLFPGRQLYPIQATQTMMNLVGSHDTERFINLAKGDVRRLKLSALFQMTYVGIPQIYYGDEVGLEGGRDPDNRRTFPWDWKKDPERKAIHDYYQKLTELRHEYSALRTGSFESILMDGKTYGYVREDKKGTFLIILNNEESAKEVTVDISAIGGGKYQDLLTGEKLKVKENVLNIELDALSGVLLKKD
ncbi:alpha amylase N-terminal ig-like domain-containing protein [candidate division KSB1 bacterium]|nr:alpha amylase N-terminal ig-like domain-containing protein [candidate division KSB1 bacterium]